MTIGPVSARPFVVPSVSTRAAEPLAPATGHSDVSRFEGIGAPSAPAAFTGGGAPVFTGFDAQKLAAPLKLGDDGRPKSAKYTFAQLAQQSGSMPKSKAEAEAWFNANIRGGLEAAGFKVGEVKGDRAFIHTRENPQGEWVDFVQGAASGDPKLAWQPDAPGGAPAPAAAATFVPLPLSLAPEQPKDDERKRRLSEAP